MTDNNTPKTSKEPENIQSVIQQYPLISKAVAASVVLLAIFWFFTLVPKKPDVKPTYEASKKYYFEPKPIYPRRENKPSKQEQKTETHNLYKIDKPTAEDAIIIGTLKGQYKTRANRIAKIDALEPMVHKLKRAMKKIHPDDIELYKAVQSVKDQAARELRAENIQLEFIKKSIRELEKKISDRKFLPAQPTNSKDYVINSANAYRNLKINYPNLFN